MMEMVLNKVHMRLWVQALRSGEYRAGRYALRDEEGYCCLGVACELAMADGVPVVRQWHEGERLFRYDNLASILPNRVMEWLGIDSVDPPIRKPLSLHDNSVWAGFANDNGMPFGEIADLIEIYYDLKEESE